MAKLSVIVPCYNVEDYLNECLDSIINQTFRDIEVICINDGSTDKTLNILNSYAKKDSRIRIINQTNQGLSMARNVGLKNISGDFVTFIDSDDFFELTAFEEALNIIEEKSLDLLLFKLINFDDETLEKNIDSYFEMDFLKEIVGDNVFNHSDLDENIYIMSVTAPGKIYDSNLIQDMEFPEGLIFEDNLFFIEVMFRAKRVYFYDKYLYYRRMRAESITHSASDKFYHIIEINNLIIDITKKYGFFEKYQKTLYRKKILLIHGYFNLINKEEKEFYFKKMKEDYKKFEKEYKSSEAFYNLTRRQILFFDWGLDCKSSDEYQLKTDNNDMIHYMRKENREIRKQNRKLKKENKKIKKEIKSIKRFNNIILNSRSWKITKPLRKLINLFK